MLTGSLVKLLAKALAPLMAVLVVATLRPFLRALTFMVPAHRRPSYLQNVAEFSGTTNVGLGSVLAVALSIALYIYAYSELSPSMGDGAFIVAVLPAGFFFYFYFFALTYWRAATDNRFAASAVGGSESSAARAIASSASPAGAAPPSASGSVKAGLAAVAALAAFIAAREVVPRIVSSVKEATTDVVPSGLGLSDAELVRIRPAFEPLAGVLRNNKNLASELAALPPDRVSAATQTLSSRGIRHLTPAELDRLAELKLSMMKRDEVFCASMYSGTLQIGQLVRALLQEDDSQIAFWGSVNAHAMELQYRHAGSVAAAIGATPESPDDNGFATDLQAVLAGFPENTQKRILEMLSTDQLPASDGCKLNRILHQGARALPPEARSRYLATLLAG